MLIAPLLPPARRGGRARTPDLRAVTDAIFHIGISGCQWRMLAKDFPPVSTVRGCFHAWRNAGLWQTINHLPVAGTRKLEGREASPPIIIQGGGCDRQPERENDREGHSSKTTGRGGVCGYDAGKRVKGRTRHIVTDTLGLMLFAVIHAADTQDRDGAPEVPGAIRYRFPWLRHVFAGGGYAGEKPSSALKRHGDWTIETVKRSDTASGFEVLPRRRVVERSFAWLGRCRREAKDCEASIESSTAWAFIASNKLMA